MIWGPRRQEASNFDVVYLITGLCRVVRREKSNVRGLRSFQAREE